MKRINAIMLFSLLMVPIFNSAQNHDLTSQEQDQKKINRLEAMVNKGEKPEVVLKNELDEIVKLADRPIGSSFTMIFRCIILVYRIISCAQFAEKFGLQEIMQNFQKTYPDFLRVVGFENYSMLRKRALEMGNR